MKVNFTIKEVMKATGARHPSAEAALKVPESVSGVSIDSRTIRTGELFVALKGANFDGHDFVEEALSKGASAALVSDDWLSSLNSKKRIAPLLAVRDTLAAFQELGRYNRIRVHPRVVAVTGSNGKTTTKDMIAAISSSTYRTARTQGNLNNQFGVPITLLQLEAGVEVAVLEMGMNRPGEIRRLTGLCMPSVGVITNATACHLEGMGTVHDVVRAKSELAEDLRKDDSLVIYRDSDELYSLNSSRRCRLVSFGMSEKAHVFPREVRYLGAGQTELVIEGFPPIRLSLLGKQNVLNALAALATSKVLGVSADKAARALGAVRAAKGRMEMRTIGPATFIDDSYNANPASMKMALESLFSLEGFGRRVAVLGDMLELGETSEKWHMEVGSEASRADAILLYGEFAQAVRKGAEDAGMSAGAVWILESHTAIAERIMSIWKPGDLFLIKGSRAMAMEKVLDELTRRVNASSGSRAASSRRGP